MGLLGEDWYMASPVDFEHKKWLFLGYLRDLGDNFTKLEFSPWLLHSERLLRGMIDTKTRINDAKTLLKQEKIEIIGSIMRKSDHFLSFPDDLLVFLDILDYSIPLLKKKVDFGRNLWESNKSILY